MAIIVPALIDEIADCVKILCDNQLDKLSIYNILLAKFCSVLSAKNLATKSVRSSKPFPLAYYGVNLLPSGGNKNKPLMIIEDIFDWIEDEYKAKNQENKEKYINGALNKCDGEVSNKEKDKIEKQAENLQKLKSKINGATAPKIYAICNQILKSGFGSLFIYDTEFIKRFEQKIGGNSSDEALDLIYNLYDGSLDFIDTVMTDREALCGISCSVCYASDYSRLLRNQKTNKEFKNYLQDGFGRRIFLYTAQNAGMIDNSNNYPSVEEVEAARNKLFRFRKITKNIYDSIDSSLVYEFSREADNYIQKYNATTLKNTKDFFSYAEVLCDDDEILRVNLFGSAWKIVKTAFLFHFIQHPAEMKVGVDCVKMAVEYFKVFHEQLEYFLNKKAIDEFDVIKNYICKNLNKEMLKNTEFRQALGVHHTKWKDFWNNTFVPNILQELAEDNIYMQEGKRGRKDTVMFYRKVL